MALVGSIQTFEKIKWQSRMDNPETLATLDTNTERRKKLAEKKKMSNMDPIKKREWTQKFAKCTQLLFFILVDANSTITKLGIIWWNDIIYIAEHEVKGSGILFYVFLEKRLYEVCLRKHDLGEQIFILIRCYCENAFINWHQFSWFLKSPLIHGFLSSWFRCIFIFVL